MGCDGGSLRAAFRYVTREGLTSELHYPYIGKVGRVVHGICYSLSKWQYRLSQRNLLYSYPDSPNHNKFMSVFKLDASNFTCCISERFLPLQPSFHQSEASPMGYAPIRRWSSNGASACYNRTFGSCCQRCTVHFSTLSVRIRLHAKEATMGNGSYNSS